MKKAFIFIFAVILVLLATFLIRYAKKISNTARTYISSVSKIVDGDLIQLPNNRVVDLAGVYIPKRGEINYRRELAGYINKLLLNQNVTVETIETKNADYPEYDLVKVYLPVSKESVNEKLLKEGKAFFDHGFYTGKDYFYKLQKQAEKKKIGIWKNKENLKVLFIGGKSWKRYHFFDCPEVKKLKNNEKIYYYFEPPSIYAYRTPHRLCYYCKEEFVQYYSSKYMSRSPKFVK